jgi:hypothetical protein
MLDRDARGVTKQNSVPSLPDHAVKVINFFLSAGDELVQLLTKVPKLAKRQYARRLAIFGSDAVRMSGPLPGGRHLLDAR